MDEPTISNWERGAPKGRRSLVLLLGFVVVTIACVAGLFIWLFNTPDMRIQGEIYDQAPDIVTRTHYSTLNGSGDTLTIFVARDVTREEALDLQCRLVIPLLIREHIAPRVVIVHPDNRFRLDGEPCRAP